MSNSSPQHHKNNAPIRIVLADDNDVVRSSLRLLFNSNPDLDLVGEASDGFEAINVCTRLQPDLVLMDIDMPFVDGIQATRILRGRFPDMYILAVSAINDNGKKRKILQNGANGLIAKQTTADELTSEIYAGMNRNGFLPRQRWIRTQTPS